MPAVPILRPHDQGYTRLSNASGGCVRLFFSCGNTTLIHTPILLVFQEQLWDVFIEAIIPSNVQMIL